MARDFIKIPGGKDRLLNKICWSSSSKRPKLLPSRARRCLRGCHKACVPGRTYITHDPAPSPLPVSKVRAASAAEKLKGRDWYLSSL